MKQVLQTLRGELRIEEVPPPGLRPGGVLVVNACSLVSAGTERTTVERGRRSLVSKALARQDLVRQVLRKARDDGLGRTLQAVWDRLNGFVPLGYSSAGVVAGVGAGCDLAVGDRVACTGGGYAAHAEMIWVPANLCVRLPIRTACSREADDPEAETISFEEGAFGALGAIALHGARQAELQVGDRIAVLGLGLVGLLTVQILKAAGCRVLGVDLDPGRVALARTLGVDEAVVAGCYGDAEHKAALARSTDRLTGGLGFDRVILTAASDSADPVLVAGELCRDRGRVVVVGAVRMDVPRQLYYDKELELRLARSYGPGRYDPVYEEQGIDYPLGYVRWTERRNIEAFLDLVAQGKVAVLPLVTHRIPIEDALSAYQLLAGERKEPYLGIVLTYASAAAPPTRRVELSPPRTRRSVAAGDIVLGVIGAGSFAQWTLLPILQSLPGVRLRGVATGTGVSAKHVGARHKFAYCTTDFEEILADEAINAVLIATRHDLHATLTSKAIQAGKHVFVEKPLCIAREELDLVREAVEIAGTSGRQLMVGFNRRFSQHTTRVRELLGRRSQPAVILYRINAGAIPKEHWVHDPAVGGGRIVGEVCHFVDYCSALVGIHPLRVAGRQVAGASVLISLWYPDGSVAEIQYLENGPTDFPKERVEVFAEQTVCVVDDFRRSEWMDRQGRRHVTSLSVQDKGHRGELEAWVASMRSGGPCPVNPRDAFRTSEVMFRILDAVVEGQVQKIEEL